MSKNFNENIHQLLDGIVCDDLPWTDDTKGYWFNKLNDWYIDQRENHDVQDLKTFPRSAQFGDKPCSIEEYCETLFKVLTDKSLTIEIPPDCLDDEDKYQQFIAQHRDKRVDISDKIL